MGLISAIVVDKAVIDVAVGKVKHDKMSVGEGANSKIDSWQIKGQWQSRNWPLPST